MCVWYYVYCQLTHYRNGVQMIYVVQIIKYYNIEIEADNEEDAIILAHNEASSDNFDYTDAFIIDEEKTE